MIIPSIFQEFLHANNEEPCVQVISEAKQECAQQVPDPATLWAGATLIPAALKEKKVVEVAAAVLCRYQKNKDDETHLEILLTMRPQNRVYAGFWEFPGGKLEEGETHSSALVREIREELGVTIENPVKLTTREYDYPHAFVRIEFFAVTAWQGALQLLEHDGMVWQPIDSITISPLLPANEGLIEALSQPLTQYLENR